MIIDDVRRLVGKTLRIEDRIAQLGDNDTLLGAVPELDSIAVVQLLTALEERFDIEISDDDIDASAFLSLSALATFVQQRLDA